MKRYRIALADDHVMLREGIKKSLTNPREWRLSGRPPTV